MLMVLGPCGRPSCILSRHLGHCVSQELSCGVKQRYYQPTPKVQTTPKKRKVEQEQQSSVETPPKAAKTVEPAAAETIEAAEAAEGGESAEPPKGGKSVEEHADVAAELDALFRDGDGDGGEGEEEEGPDQGEDDEEVEPAAEEKSSDTLVVKSWPESKAELQFSNKKGLVLKSHGRRKSLKLKDHVLVEIEGGQVQLTAAPGECDLQWKLIKATKLLFVSDEGRKCLKVSDILKQKNVQTVYGHALASGNKIGPLKDGKQAARPCLGNRELGT